MGEVNPHPPGHTSVRNRFVCSCRFGQTSHQGRVNTSNRIQTGRIILTRKFHQHSSRRFSRIQIHQMANAGLKGTTGSSLNGEGHSNTRRTRHEERSCLGHRRVQPSRDGPAATFSHRLAENHELTPSFRSMLRMICPLLTTIAIRLQRPRPVRKVGSDSDDGYRLLTWRGGQASAHQWFGGFDTITPETGQVKR